MALRTLYQSFLDSDPSLLRVIAQLWKVELQSSRRPDIAAELVTELSHPGTEEDELGLVAVDLTGFDLDEALLDLDVPAVTLGRVLYDTQRGTHRSTLTLTGDVPLERGAALMARVAELLESPVRLLL